MLSTVATATLAPAALAPADLPSAVVVASVVFVAESRRWPRAETCAAPETCATAVVATKPTCRRHAGGEELGRVAQQFLALSVRLRDLLQLAHYQRMLEAQATSVYRRRTSAIVAARAVRGALQRARTNSDPGAS